MRRTTAAAVAALGLASCRTVKARLVDQPIPREEVGGIPIVVERPRWVKVTHKDVTYAVFLKDKREDEKTTVERWTESRSFTKREITSEIVSVGETYALDVDRPFSGAGKAEIAFAEGRQYPKAVKSETKDETVESVAGALDRLLPYVKAAETQAARSSASGADVVKVSESVVRIDFYDVRNPSCLLFTYCPSECAAPPAPLGAAGPPVGVVGPPATGGGAPPRVPTR